MGRRAARQVGEIEADGCDRRQRGAGCRGRDARAVAQFTRLARTGQLRRRARRPDSAVAGAARGRRVVTRTQTGGTAGAVHHRARRRLARRCFEHDDHQAWLGRVGGAGLRGLHGLHEPGSKQSRGGENEQRQSKGKRAEFHGGHLWSGDDLHLEARPKRRQTRNPDATGECLFCVVDDAIQGSMPYRGSRCPDRLPASVRVCNLLCKR